MTEALTQTHSHTWPTRQERVRHQMQMTHVTSWARPWPSQLLDRLRGTERRARRLRGFVMTESVMTLVIGVMMLSIVPSISDRPQPMFKVFGIACLVIGAVVAGAVVACRPIPKVTWRAWLAGRWHARDLRRNAVNAGGHPSARARRSVQNKAAWAAQRQRSGRAARREYGSSLRKRIIES